MEQMFSGGSLVTCSRGQTIDTTNFVYFIRSGVAGLYASADNEHKLLFGFRSHEIFPLNHAIESRITGRAYTYRALSSLNLLRVTREDFAELLKIGENLKAYTECLTTISLHQMERIDNLQEEKALPRLAERLLYIAYRFGKFNGDSVVIETPMSHADLAGAINVSRETINRHMRLLEDMGLLNVRKRRIRIHSVRGIQDIVDIPRHGSGTSAMPMSGIALTTSIAETILSSII